MTSVLARLSTSGDGRVPRAPLVGAALSLVLGLIFVFVWAPHPWGWHGIDQYHELARALARGEGFTTTDVPWGYAYFVAAFYAAFGERAWIPVTAQVIANATIPLMVYALVRPLASERIAAISSMLVGALSFNTVYASTESSDAMCTVLFVASLLCLLRGYQTDQALYFAIGGLLSGTVPQFRPNMILLPAVLAAAYVLFSGARARAARRMSLFLAMVAIALAPWVIRNYQLTGTILPTSTHGGVQLWYGTLQVGEYLESRAHNPRSVFEAAPFDYTSLAGQPIVVTGVRPICPDQVETIVTLTYRTDRDPRPIHLAPIEVTDERVIFEIPGQPSPTAIYYYFETRGRNRAGEVTVQTTPVDADIAPSVYFVASEHLIDLDRHGDLLDVFDLIRTLRGSAWNEEQAPEAIDSNGDGVIDEADVRNLAVLLLGGRATADTAFGAKPLAVSEGEATLRLSDGSTLSVPRRWSGRVTDIDVRGVLAGSLIPAHRPMSELARPAPRREPCGLVWDVQMNDVFYRKEPHLMRRYLALAFDNISRDPRAFAAASAYRMGRLFVVRGSDDLKTTQQFTRSGLVYGAGLAVSALYLLLFVAGVFVVWRARLPMLALLLPIVYVPLTICFVLTNMRYTITVQPLMFAFVAAAISRATTSRDWTGADRNVKQGEMAGGTRADTL
jgi:hypothetical protein